MQMDTRKLTTTDESPLTKWNAQILYLTPHQIKTPNQVVAIKLADILRWLWRPNCYEAVLQNAGRTVDTIDHVDTCACYDSSSFCERNSPSRPLYTCILVGNEALSGSDIRAEVDATDIRKRR